MFLQQTNSVTVS